MGKVEIAIIESALRSDRRGRRLGEYLINQGWLEQADLDRALRRQQGDPGGGLPRLSYHHGSLPIGSTSA